MNPLSNPICQRFDRQAARYDELADVQQGIAWRLAHWIARLPIPAGPCGDLGAGSGLVGQALAQQAPTLNLQQLDGSASLLARNPLASPGLLWDLEAGLPEQLQRCALLTSSFSLQWLSEPTSKLQLWARALAPGGWLVLAVPVAGSFPQWREAATKAQLPWTAQPLPQATALIESAGTVLDLETVQELRFSRLYGAGGASTGRQFLRWMQQLGAGGSSQTALSPSQWRRLLAHWPDSPQVSWQVLLLVGQRSSSSSSRSAP